MNNSELILQAIANGHETMAAMEEETGLDHDRLRAARTYLVASGQIEVYRTIKEKEGRGRKAGCYRLTGHARKTVPRKKGVVRHCEDASINTDTLVRNAVARFCSHPGPFGGLIA